MVVSGISSVAWLVVIPTKKWISDPNLYQVFSLIEIKANEVFSLAEPWPDGKMSGMSLVDIEKNVLPGYLVPCYTVPMVENWLPLPK